MKIYVVNSVCKVSEFNNVNRFNIYVEDNNPDLSNCLVFAGEYKLKYIKNNFDNVYSGYPNSKQYRALIDYYFN